MTDLDAVMVRFANGVRLTVKPTKFRDDEVLVRVNIGGGLKWYAPNGRWGLRGDYRFIAVRSNDTAPAFFGQDTRYGHRVYGAVIINAVR